MNKHTRNSSTVEFTVLEEITLTISNMLNTGKINSLLIFGEVLNIWYCCKSLPVKLCSMDDSWTAVWLVGGWRCVPRLVWY